MKRKLIGLDARVFQVRLCDDCVLKIRRMNSFLLQTTINPHYNTPITFSQHEYDHIEGVVYIDRLSPQERRKVQGRLDELVKDYGYGGVL